MPELPEVETIRRGLGGLLLGKTIVRATCLDSPKSFPNSDNDVVRFMVGAKVTSIRRRAKVLLLDLSSKYTLVIHLKMTGQLVYVNNNHAEERFGGGHPTNSLIDNLPDRSTRVVIEFSDESKLFFNDQRKFGWMRLLPTISVMELDFMRKFGPEPLESKFTSADFIAQINRRSVRSIKATILDQTVIAGVGNIYADESLWGARLHPASLARDVTDRQLAELLKEIKYVMNLSLEKGGSTDRNYVDAEGKKGSYLEFARVFRREGKPCPRCGTTVEKIRVAGRGTHLCPHCQKLEGAQP